MQKRLWSWLWVGCLCLAAAGWAQAQVVINEIDANQSGPDEAEFVELYDGGVGNTSLDGYALVLYNGGNDEAYATILLDGFSTNGQGYFVVGTQLIGAVADVLLDGGSLQNGADAVALYSVAPPNSAITTDGLVSAVVYGQTQADDAELLVLLNAGQPQVAENADGTSDFVSMQRCPATANGPRDTAGFVLALPTPGAPNGCA